MENLIFKLTDIEMFNAKRFRLKHKRIGCKIKGILGFSHREVQDGPVLFSYIFRQIDSDTYSKYIKCNICGEEEEITEKKVKKNL